jgi:hypothetical protein
MGWRLFHRPSETGDIDAQISFGHGGSSGDGVSGLGRARATAPFGRLPARQYQ